MDVDKFLYKHAMLCKYGYAVTMSSICDIGKLQTHALKCIFCQTLHSFRNLGTCLLSNFYHRRSQAAFQDAQVVTKCAPNFVWFF